MDQTLRYGSLVLDEEGLYGILLSNPDPRKPESPVLVAWGNGLEERRSPIGLEQPVLFTANFREWVMPKGEPVTRALNAFAGSDAVEYPESMDGIILGLYVSLTRMVAGMDPDRFDDMTKLEFVDNMVRMLQDTPEDGR